MCKRFICLMSVAVVFYVASFQVNAGILWTDSYTYNNRAYFLYSTASKIEIYDLQTETWLQTVSYQGVASTLAVDDSGIYLAESSQVHRLSLDGLTQTYIASASQPISQLMLSNTHIYALKSNEMWAIQKSNGSLQYKSYSYSIQKAVYSPINNKIFARNTGVSPADIMMIGVNVDGTLGVMTDSPYHGDYPSAVKTWLSYDQSKVIDSAGVVYSPSLNWLGSVGGGIENMLPMPDGRFVTINQKSMSLIGDNYGVQKISSLSYVSNAAAFYNNTIYSFSTGQTDAIVVEKRGIAQFLDRPKAVVVNPLSISYVPDAIVLGSDNIVYLLHKASKNIFRWSVDQQAYLDSIPLLGDPYRIAFSQGLGRLFVLYSNSEITSIDPATLLESFLFRLADAPCGLSASDKYVMACDASGAWVSHSIISPSGSRLAYKDWNYYSSEYIWDSVRSRFYFFRDDTSPNDLHWEEVLANGNLGASGETPYHGSPLSTVHPIKVMPNGAAVLLGSGQILDASSLNIVFTLPEQIAAAVWVNGVMYTAKKLVSGAQIDRWSSLYSREFTYTLYGTITDMLNVGGRIVVISKRNNTTVFSVMSDLGDIDADGVQDFADPTPIGVDLDGDQVGDHKDNCINLANPDQLDPDQDGLGNSCDSDDDGDGVSDAQDLCPLNPFCTADTDMDGVDNTVDGDDDNDGIADGLDNCSLVKNSNQLDTDIDGFGDVCDGDDDGDGVNDFQDAFPLDPAESFDIDSDGVGNNADTDDDGDGIFDLVDNCPGEVNVSQLDNDMDGHGDICDADDDNDGVPDITDVFPLDASESLDTDKDGLGDNSDNCKYVSNVNQADFEHDGQGDACDTDDDNDGVVDLQDAFPFNAGESVDFDKDGIGNNADIDDDNDGIADVVDVFPLNRAVSADTDMDGFPDAWLDSCDLSCRSASGLRLDNCKFIGNVDQLDTDADGAGDECDADDDNDGMPDDLDAFKLDVMASVDTDADGMPDSIRKIENFETGNLQGYLWGSDGDTPWLVDTSRFHSGAYSARSAPIGNYKKSTLQLGVTTGNSVDFWVFASTEGGYDFLKFYIDGVVVAQWSGNVSWQHFTKIIAAGHHVFRWEYSKDGTLSVGSDAVWVDDINFSTGLVEDLDDDNDGISDTTDAFPLSASESIDLDLDGIGNNSDLDDDGDGVSDYIDADPLNPVINTEKIMSLNGLYRGSSINESSVQ